MATATGLSSRERINNLMKFMSNEPIAVGRCEYIEIDSDYPFAYCRVKMLGENERGENILEGKKITNKVSVADVLPSMPFEKAIKVGYRWYTELEQNEVTNRLIARGIIGPENWQLIFDKVLEILEGQVYETHGVDVLKKDKSEPSTSETWDKRNHSIRMHMCDVLVISLYKKLQLEGEPTVISPTEHLPSIASSLKSEFHEMYDHDTNATMMDFVAANFDMLYIIHGYIWNKSYIPVRLVVPETIFSKRGHELNSNRYFRMQQVVKLSEIERVFVSDVQARMLGY